MATFPLSSQLQRYLTESCVREGELLAELRTITQAGSHAFMQISPEQGQFLSLLVQLTGAQRCIEVGTFTGYSSLCIATALPEKGRLICCDVSAEWTAIARRFWQRAGVGDKIDLRLAPALETLDALIASGEAGTYDFAFIDANKENYLEYYERCLQLLRPGGLAAADNTLWSGRVADPGDQSVSSRCLREFNARLLRDELVAIALLPLGDGLSLALKH
ncbi:MAG TPA: class I SAM-dependent methyltransferase [Burkholderiales bacterium]|nr:class I SAM-dependent methyltransferase [Burkholderiales bacterium]